MTKANLDELIKESSKYGDEAQYIAKLIEHSILFQSEKFKKIENRICKIQDIQNQQQQLLKVIACNFNPIFAFETATED